MPTRRVLTVAACLAVASLVACVGVSGQRTECLQRCHRVFDEEIGMCQGLAQRCADMTEGRRTACIGRCPGSPAPEAAPQPPPSLNAKNEYGLPLSWDVSMLTPHPTGPHRLGPKVQACQQKEFESRTNCVKNALGPRGPAACQQIYEAGMMRCVTKHQQEENVAAGRPATQPTPQGLTVCQFGCHDNSRRCMQQNCGNYPRPGCGTRCDSERTSCLSRCPPASVKSTTTLESQPNGSLKEVTRENRMMPPEDIPAWMQGVSCPISFLEVANAPQLTAQQEAYCREQRAKHLAAKAKEGKAAAAPTATESQKTQGKEGKKGGKKEGKQGKAAAPKADGKKAGGKKAGGSKQAGGKKADGKKADGKKAGGKKGGKKQDGKSQKAGKSSAKAGSSSAPSTPKKSDSAKDPRTQGPGSAYRRGQKAQQKDANDRHHAKNGRFQKETATNKDGRKFDRRTGQLLPGKGKGKGKGQSPKQGDRSKKSSGQSQKAAKSSTRAAAGSAPSTPKKSDSAKGKRTDGPSSAYRRGQKGQKKDGQGRHRAKNGKFQVERARNSKGQWFDRRTGKLLKCKTAFTKEGECKDKKTNPFSPNAKVKSLDELPDRKSGAKANF